MPEAEAEIIIRPIEPGDKVTGLSLGDPDFQPLKTFFKSQAKNFQDKSLARTYVAEVDEKIIGYVTLVCGEVASSAENIGSDIDGYRYDHFPSAKIARLAVDKKYQGSGLGRHLVDFSLGLVKNQICPAIGCRFVVVDSKKKSMDFYKKVGFTLLDTEENINSEFPIFFIDLNRA